MQAQNLQQLLVTAWTGIKTVAPWLTEGWPARHSLMSRTRGLRGKSCLGVTSQRVDYSVAARDEGLKELRVLYAGENFESLNSTL
jgi:hypothetical protein